MNLEDEILEGIRGLPESSKAEVLEQVNYLKTRAEDSNQSEEGMVAFLDILGYSNFLEKNRPEEAAQPVLDYFLNAPDNVKAALEAITVPEYKRWVRGNVEQLKWLIFSDTIVVTNAYDTPGDTNNDKIARWNVFLYTLVLLYRTLFDSGLPIRGAVSYGMYSTYFRRARKSMGLGFTGLPMIKAYTLANSLNLSAIAVDPTALNEISSLERSANWGTLKTALSYLVPLKNQPSTEMSLLIPSIPTSPDILPPLDSADLRQTVAESFWRYRKDMPPEVLEKMQNTEMFLRFARMNPPELFANAVGRNTTDG